MMKKLLLLFALMGASVGAQAHSYQLKTIQIGHAWSLPTDSNETCVFFPLLNSGGVADRLVAMSSPVAKSVVYVDRFGTVQSTLTLAPKVPLALRKGGACIKLLGVKKALKTGARIPLTLSFETAGPITIEVWIEPAPYAKPHQH